MGTETTILRMRGKTLRGPCSNLLFRCSAVSVSLEFYSVDIHSSLSDKLQMQQVSIISHGI